MCVLFFSSSSKTQIWVFVYRNIFIAVLWACRVFIDQLSYSSDPNARVCVCMCARLWAFGIRCIVKRILNGKFKTRPNVNSILQL